MTYESLTEGIKRLIIKRKIINDPIELTIINKKLKKLYDLKYLMIMQKIHNEIQEV